MAFKHNTSDTADGILTQGEYESTSGHVLDSQAAGDMIVADTTTTMTRLAVGSADEVLTSNGSTPTYSKITTSNINASTLVIESEGIGSNDNDTTIPTSAAVKDYVDNTITAQDLDFTGDSGGPSAVDLDSQTLTIAGTTNEIETSVSGQTLTVGIVTNPTIGGNLTVTGDLTVNGTTTTVDTTNTIVKDPLIELNTGAASNANDLGIVMERGSTGDNAIVAWDESADGFIVGTTTATGASTGNLTIAAAPLTASTFTGNLTGNVTGNVTGTAATVTDATQAAITTAANLTTVGTLASGAISSGFGNIDIGSSTFDTTGAVSTGDLSPAGDVAVADAKYIKLGGSRMATLEPATDSTGYGVVIGFDSAGSVSAGDAVYINSSGKVAQANAQVGSVTDPVIGIATNAGASDGDDVYVLTHGIWRMDAETFTAGDPVYLGETAGALTATAPSTDGDYVQRIGIAVSDDCVLVMPSIDVIEHA
jgi:hypothetical protein